MSGTDLFRYTKYLRLAHAHAYVLICVWAREKEKQSKERQRLRRQSFHQWCSYQHQYASSLKQLSPDVMDDLYKIRPATLVTHQSREEAQTHTSTAGYQHPSIPHFPIHVPPVTEYMSLLMHVSFRAERLWAAF